MSDFLKITSADNWFKQHPEKIAGVEYETTSFFFPIMVKGTKEDVLRVTGMSESNVNDNNIDEDEIYFNTIGEQSPTIRMFQRSENYFKNYTSNVSNYVGINKFDKEDNTRWIFKNTFYDVKDNDLEFELKDLLNQYFRTKYDLFLINKQLPNIEKKYPNRNFAKKYHKEAHDFYQNKLQNEKSYRATLVAIDYVMQRLKEIYKNSNSDKEKRIRIAKAKAKAIKIKLLLK